MPINPNNMLAPLSPMAPIKPLDFGGGGGGGMERQRLSLLKQQFEETKRKNRVDEETDRLRVAATTRAEELALQKQKEQAAFLAAAELRKQQEQAYADFHKATDARDFAGMATAAERLRVHGGLAQELGLDPEGRPSYRVAPSAEEYQEQEATREEQAAPAGGPESSAQSLNRLNALGYDVANEHVVDAGELADTSRAQMGPVLQGFRNSLPPGAYQESADSTIGGVQSLGYGPEKSIELLGKLSGLSQPAIGKSLDIEQKRAEDEAKAAAAAVPKPLTEKQKQEVFNDGKGAAGTLWKDRGLNNPLQAQKSAHMVLEMLSDKDQENDRMVGFYLVDMLGSRGPQSNSDINIALGIDSLSSAAQIREAWTKYLEGGFSEERRTSIKNVIEKSIEQDDERMYEFLDIAAKSLQNPENHPEYLRGWREFINSVPEDTLAEWNKDREKQGLPTLDELAQAKPAEEDEPAEPGGKPQMPPRVERHSDRLGLTPTSNPTSDEADELTSEFERPPGTPGSALEGPPTAPAEKEPAASGDFDAELERQANEAGLNPEAIRGVMGPESGGDPGKVNKTSGATGLIQFMPDIAKGLGTSTEELKKMSAVVQLQYVIKYFKDRGLTKDDDQGKYYVAVAAGGKLKGEDRAHFVDQPDDTVVYEKGSKGWKGNVPWRPADGGDITVGSIKAYGGGGKKTAKKNPIALEEAAEPGDDDGELDALLGGG